MVILTDEQVNAMLRQLDKAQEIFDSMADGAEYAIRNLADEKRSLEREVERLKNRLKSTEEELAMVQKALDDSAEMIDEKNLTINSYAQTVTQYQLILNDFDRMKLDYYYHRGRFGGAGVASEIDSVMHGDGYIQARSGDQE